MLQSKVDASELVGGLPVLTRGVVRCFGQDAVVEVANEGHVVNCSGAGARGPPRWLLRISWHWCDSEPDWAGFVPCPWQAGGFSRAPGASLLSRASFLL